MTHKKQFSLIAFVMRVLFSNAGLVLIICGYVCIGAFMFQLLEQHNELTKCQEGKAKFAKAVKELRENLVRYVLFDKQNEDSNSNLIRSQSEIAEYLDSLNKSNTIDNYLDIYRNLIIELDTSFKYNGQSTCEENSKWKFFSALLFSITVITTMGYGHVTPQTWEGQIVCICYANIGIPIFLLCLSNLSHSFSEMVTFVFNRFQAWNPFERSLKEDSSMNELSLANLEILATFNNDRGSFMINKNTVKMIKEISNQIDSEEKKSQENQVQVPFSVALFLIIIYIAFGAFLFKFYEDWNLAESAYFVYATLSTIGFGDFVPGLQSNDKWSNFKLITTAFYSLFGITLITMCFRLMQDVTVRTLKSLIARLKIFLNPPKDKILAGEIEKEKLKQDVIKKIRFLQSYHKWCLRRRLKKVFKIDDTQ